jgi:cytochrome c556
MFRNRRKWPKLTAATVALAVTVTWPAAVGAQVDRQQVIEERVAGFRDMGSAFKNLGVELRSARPNMAKIRSSVGVIRTYAKAVPRWFPPGSAPERRPPQGLFGWACGFLPCGGSAYHAQDIVSHAKPEIWSQPAQFRQAHSQLNVAVEAMWRSSRAGDLAVMRTQFRSLEATCKSCHDRFREKID